MDQELQRRWDAARAHETARNLAAARQEYQSIVQTAPAHAPAWLRLSVLEQAADHYQASLEHARRAAVSVAGTQAWQHISSVTMRLLRFGDFSQARKLIHTANWSHPDVIRQSPVLSQHLWLAGDYEGALRLIDGASRRVAPNHLLSYSRANALRYSGRLDEAADEFERCIALAPHYAPAHWSLAYHCPSVPRGNRVDRVRAALAVTAAGSPAQADLHYALFKELADLGDVDSAWEALSSGARAKRATLRYDTARQREGFERLRLLVTADWLAETRARNAAHVPIFILGMPRTGTTLLDRVLGNHSRVVSAGELNNFAAAISWEADHFYAGADVPRSLEKVKDIDFAKVGERYLQSTAHHRGGYGFVIDKNPANFANAGFIAKALPDARIICLVKNPMDACFSNLKELFDGGAYPYSYDLVELAEYHAEFLKMVEHWKRVLGPRFHVVQYEEFVADPEETSRRVQTFCGLAYEEGCSRVESNSAPVATASSSQVRQPIHDRFVEAWKPYARHLRPLQGCLEENAVRARNAD